MIFFLIIGIVLIVFGFYMSWYTKFYALEKIGQNIKIAKKKELNDTSIEDDKDENVNVNNPIYAPRFVSEVLFAMTVAISGKMRISPRDQITTVNEANR